jgi:hypothetical protein
MTRWIDCALAMIDAFGVMKIGCTESMMTPRAFANS